MAIFWFSKSSKNSHVGVKIGLGHGLGHQHLWFKPLNFGLGHGLIQHIFGLIQIYIKFIGPHIFLHWRQ